MDKVLLYYKFTPISDPEMARLWQRALCMRLNLKGRIIVSKHGINGTVGGSVKDLKEYIKESQEFAGLKGTVFKWSNGSRDDFPRLSVKVRPELVAFGAPDAITVDKNGVVGGGVHLKPHQVNELVEQRGDDVVFFDGRNEFEAKIGKFKNAVVPNVRYTREFLEELDDPKYDAIKEKPVVTYCTGGIRCELLSAHMKNKGFKEVYQIDGGIVKYGEAFADDGLWEGKLYVFDKRMVSAFSDKAKDIGTCIHCGKSTSNYENCANKACNDLILICATCHEHKTTCSKSCERALAQHDASKK